ncbi:MAG: UDP-N-acetylmuramoyl-L-alanine--D-glutamate ligase [Spirochaetaceae bacterium]|jgi:UDP-N-acetylmuramoylalanine--D-glutamate ligase|nr:UDP-N-acetylmuramoyl-L-alanine--D-glutamate ligase [Spirochaetaceae bacterium]
MAEKLTAAADFAGKKILVMGLGLNGGGLCAARFLAGGGAELTVSDMREAESLSASIGALDEYVREIGAKQPRYVLGRHEQADFKAADIVVKNPAVRPDSPYLRGCRCIETDISLFLRYSPARLIAVTGTKGKSFTSSAIHYTLEKLLSSSGEKDAPASYLGGNITVSPLNFLEKLRPGDFVTLELSSFQLGDLPRTASWNGGALLRPCVAVLTAIMSDHQDRYGGMEAYIADKKLIYANQTHEDATVCDGSPWGDVFARETPARVVRSSDAETWRFLNEHGGERELNVRSALAAVRELGFAEDAARRALDSFGGIEHRLELFLEKDGRRYYNDSAATIPEAAAACCRALGPQLVLVAGGADKNLDFTPLARAAGSVKAVVLLDGSAGGKLCAALEARGVRYHGPYATPEVAARKAVELSVHGGAVALSPGCASFGMFRNEFDRGKRWKEAVRQVVSQS